MLSIYSLKSDGCNLSHSFCTACFISERVERNPDRCLIRCFNMRQTFSIGFRAGEEDGRSCNRISGTLFASTRAFFSHKPAHGSQHINPILHLPLDLPSNPHTQTSPEKRARPPVLTPVLNNPMPESHPSLYHPKKINRDFPLELIAP
jgi:hypothetical protein